MRGKIVIPDYFFVKVMYALCVLWCILYVWYGVWVMSVLVYGLCVFICMLYVGSRSTGVHGKEIPAQRDSETCPGISP